MTPLDQALQAARDDNSQANFFYDAFLNSDLFIPVRKEGTEKGTWTQLQFQEKFHPLFIPQGEIRIVPVFDLRERLKEWSEERELDYILVRCHVFLKMLGENVSLSLNPGTPYGHVIGPAILAQLTRLMKPVTAS